MWREITKGVLWFPPVREVVTIIPSEIIVRWEKARTLVLRSRQLRQETLAKDWLERGISGAVKGGTDLITTGFDTAVPLGLPGPGWVAALWGTGDILSAAEALRRRRITGEKMDKIDVAMTAVSAIIPAIPSRLIIGPARGYRETLEERVYKKAVQRGYAE